MRGEGGTSSAHAAMKASSTLQPEGLATLMTNMRAAPEGPSAQPRQQQPQPPLLERRVSQPLPAALAEQATVSSRVETTPSTPPSSPSPATVTDAGGYLINHPGFISALCLVVLLPLLILLGCCIVRRVRRRAQQLEAVKKNKEAIEAHRKKKDKESSRGSEPPSPVDDDPDDAMLSPAAAAYGLLGEPPADRAPTPSRPAPVVLNPAFLPVDAYHGVPPKRFDL